ncbi:MAG: NADH-quinone oxidoreductase subunit N [Saprospiraceae bacterium]|nr:NADH-quinone oxidoreductase subunit N [Candidatus Vicinibacter affinis]
MLPLIILTIIGVLILFLGFSGRTRLIVPIAILGILGALAAYFSGAKMYSDWMIGMMSLHGTPLIFIYLILVVALFILPFINVFSRRGSEEVADFTGLILFALIGGIMMVSHLDLIVLFLGIEILSIAMYILAGADRRILQSNEASLKYFILGAFSSAILLFGIALFYASTGTLKIYDLNVGDSPIFQLSVLIIFCAFAFKVALVPFHFWAPDVYQGSPTIFTATMATIVKVAAFGALFQFLRYLGSNVGEWMFWLMSIVALSSLVLGNVMAYTQASTKRLLSYSSIVQAGFILIGFLQLKQEDSWPIIYYLIAYCLASLICFFVCYFVENQNGSDHIDEFEGLFFSNPVLAVVMTIALISLGGGPLTAGFMAKLFVLNHAASVGSIALVVMALVLAVVSMYYYFKIINRMFTKKSVSTVWSVSWTYQSVLIILSILTFVAGILPFWVVNLFK